VKQEKIYLNAYETGSELYAGLCDYMRFYNEKCPHQSIDYKCPANYYKKSCAINWNIEKNVVTLQPEK
jgi:putative transposase